jgi:hypothetical protein
VYLKAASVGRMLVCDCGRFDTLQLSTATVKQGFSWCHVQRITNLDLSNFTAGIMSDDEASWPLDGGLRLDGFVYGSISGGPTDAPAPLRWLERQSGFSPQPYRQLAKVLRELGDEEGSKQVLFELDDRSRAQDRRRVVHAPVRWLRSFGDVLSKGTVGYGFYPERAIWWLSGLIAFGWVVHRRAQQMGAMVPTDKDAYAEFHATGEAPAHYPPFSPLIYSLENSLPLVKLGQGDRWQPDPKTKQSANAPVPVTGWTAKLKNLLTRKLPDSAASPLALRWFRWIMIIFGWLLATFFVAAGTGILKKG